MRLLIKNLSQKSIFIDIEANKTVYDLKKELSLFPDVGVSPECQKLIYGGQILSNEDELSVYNIDVKKFLVVMTLKQPIRENAAQSEEAAGSGAPPNKKAKETSEEAAAAAPAAVENKAAEVKSAAKPESKSENEQMVANIVGMGYDEAEVRRALAASFNNPERAIEYLIDGIPANVVVPSAAAALESDESAATASPFESLRGDPVFRTIRHAIRQNPALMEQAIQQVYATNPAVLQLIADNQEEFLAILVDNTDDEDSDEGEGEYEEAEGAEGAGGDGGDGYDDADEQ